MDNQTIRKANKIGVDSLPPKKEFMKGIRRAPKRESELSEADKALALKNALRYVPEEFHNELSKEFLKELEETGRIYAYRFRPEGHIKAKPISEYSGKCIEGKAFQLMIDNNLSSEIALYPYELVTYGETGQVCQNWLQYNLIMKYLQALNKNQTLVISSGHPLGLFGSFESSPRIIVTNGLMIGQFDNQEAFARAAAIGVSNYGQMTAGGFMYIGPQGIVHGTYNTILNAARTLYQKSGKGEIKEPNIEGMLFVSSGLGGMSGAQGKAVEILNGVGVIAEVDYSRIQTRLDQGWVTKVCASCEEAFKEALAHKKAKKGIAIAYHGNIVDLLEYAIDKNIAIELLSDQTSCHAVYDGGYCPKGVTFEERTRLLKTNKKRFKELVDKSLKAHFQAIKKLAGRGAYFFDYGNSFMKSVYDCGLTEICKNGRDDIDGFIFPSYVEDILGPLLFDFGYGPFRWVCLSGKNDDLELTDKTAMDCIDKNARFQDYDNYIWLKNAKKNNLVVGSKARILYHDAKGRKKIALAFNKLVRERKTGPIMLGRDHHDTGGTDSPFRETSNIKDGSNITADMAAQVFAGNAARGMSLVALHNGGGVGIGRAINGGFGLVLDGSKRVDNIIESAVMWDVMGGVARRAWARNENAIEVSVDFNRENKDGHITIPYIADDKLFK